MVMVSPALNPVAVWEFEGEILVLHHPTTISSRYQAMVHCGSIRQTASILSMSAECLRTGDKAAVHFRFIKHPEYLRAGQRMVFREGRTKAVGNVTKVLPPSGHQGSNYSHLSRTKANKMLSQTSQISPSTTEQDLATSGGGGGEGKVRSENSGAARQGGSSGAKKGRSRRGGAKRKQGDGGVNVGGVNNSVQVTPLSEVNRPNI
ncbi:hypothetical protein WDU94_003039 [Cyamophila willieti]